MSDARHLARVVGPAGSREPRRPPQGRSAAAPEGPKLMPYTSHGYWVGPLVEPDPPGPPRARCGGPGMCRPCAVEAIAAGHTGLDDVAAGRRPITRRRYATRAELAVPMAAHMRAENDMDMSWEDLALAALEGLAEMHVPVDALVMITVEEET